MKFNKLFLGAALLSMGVFTSCSNDDEPANNGGQNEGDQYMAFTITTAGMGGSRAAEVGTPEFEDAEGKEGDLTSNNLYFLFYDANGNAFPLVAANVNGTTTTNIVKPTELIPNGESNGAENSINGVLVLGKPGAGYVGTKPDQALVIANPAGVSVDGYANMKLADVLAKITTVETWSATSFMMTSSTYIDGGKKVVTTSNLGNCFKETVELAKQSPAKFYIERLAAKTRVKYGDSYDVKAYKVTVNEDGTVTKSEETIVGTFKLDGEDANFTAVVNGWQLRNTNTQSLLFKNLNTTYAAWTDWTWNDATLHRSYWAESSNATTLGNTTYDLYSADQFKLGSYTATSDLANVAYCHEYTGVTPGSASTRETAAPAIVVKATIKNNGDAVDMVKWAGSYYTMPKFKELVATNYNATVGTDATAANVSLVKNLDEDGNWHNKWHAIVTIEGSAAVDMSTNFNDLLWWQDGVTSYYLNIQHLGGNYGVVRNHIYDYNFDGIIGLGIPGNAPEDLDDDEESYLAASLNVLNWHVVSNNVTLQ